MAKSKKFQVKSTTMEIRHRAVCEERDFRGDWFENIQDAEKQAEDHQLTPGKERHIVFIETEFKQKTKSYLS